MRGIISLSAVFSAASLDLFNPEACHFDTKTLNTILRLFISDMLYRLEPDWSQYRYMISVLMSAQLFHTALSKASLNDKMILNLHLLAWEGQLSNLHSN